MELDINLAKECLESIGLSSSKAQAMAQGCAYVNNKLNEIDAKEENRNHSAESDVRRM